MNPLSIILSGLIQFAFLAALPLLLYVGWHRRRHARPMAETMARAGLVLGDRRYLGLEIAGAVVVASCWLAFHPDLEPLTRHGSGAAGFAGTGLSPLVVGAALTYGFVQTGLTEEILFRGLLLGSLTRRLPLLAANLGQAAIFTIPHWLVLKIAPEFALALPVIFIVALYAGWLRHRSGSVIGPWLIHGSINTTTALLVALR